MIHIMHVRHQRCSRCGHTETLSSVYTAEELPRPGRAVKMLPCHSLDPAAPIHRIDLSPVSTPCCAACPTQDAFAVGSEIYARWQETLVRKAAEARAAAQPVAHRSPPKPQNIDDLI